jgi:hypothetical protein
MTLLHRVAAAVLLAFWLYQCEAFRYVAISNYGTKHSITYMMGQSSYDDTSTGVKAIVSSLTGLFNVGAPAAVVATSKDTAAITPEALLRGLQGNELYNMHALFYGCAITVRYELLH